MNPGYKDIIEKKSQPVDRSKWTISASWSSSNIKKDTLSLYGFEQSGLLEHKKKKKIKEI